MREVSAEYYQLTPCVGRCSTVYGDEVCRGCRRVFNEITDWNQLDLDCRARIWRRLERQLERVLRPKLVVLDKLALRRQAQLKQIKLDGQQPVWVWVYRILRHLALQPEPLEHYAIEVSLPWANWPFEQMLAHIEDELYRMAEYELMQGSNNKTRQEHGTN